jgi:hypothetical protein
MKKVYQIRVVPLKWEEQFCVFVSIKDVTEIKENEERYAMEKIKNSI